jgi:hypothetical protein
MRMNIWYVTREIGMNFQMGHSNSLMKINIMSVTCCYAMCMKNTWKGCFLVMKFTDKCRYEFTNKFIWIDFQCINSLMKNISWANHAVIAWTWNRYLKKLHVWSTSLWWLCKLLCADQGTFITVRHWWCNVTNNSVDSSTSTDHQYHYLLLLVAVKGFLLKQSISFV